VGVTHEEKRAWIMLVVGGVAYAVYVIALLGRADGRWLADVPYAASLLWTVGAAIVVSIVADIAVGIVRGPASRAKDERDRAIYRLGEASGQAFVVIGAVAAMLMAMAGWDRFWIANVIYLCFVLSAVIGSTARIVVYRRGLPRW
jgi:hypothetical protein